MKFRRGHQERRPALYPAAKYNITYVPGTLTVTKAPLTLTAESDSKTYDGKKIDNKNVSATKLANPDHKISVTLGVFDKDGKELQNGAVNPGTYTKKIKSYVIKAGETDVTANYDVKTVDGTLTIKPSDKNNSNSPKTGDTANLGLWIACWPAPLFWFWLSSLSLLSRTKRRTRVSPPRKPIFPGTMTRTTAMT